MIYIIISAVSLFATIIGAICGIGGGIIIKPVLDATGVVSVTEASFLSGCTVLVMSFYSVLKSRISGKSKIDLKIGTPLAIGSVIGGIIGQNLFIFVKNSFENQNSVGAVQAVALFLITLGTLIYTIKKEGIHTHNFKNFLFCGGLGIMLGIMSSFLGIGGGPINLVVFFYFFSMPVKTAVQNSLYVILFSQAAGILNTVVTGKVPQVEIYMILLMSAFGLFGGIIGGKLNHHLSEKNVSRLFIALMVLVMFINIINFVKYI